MTEPSVPSGPAGRVELPCEGDANGSLPFVVTVLADLVAAGPVVPWARRQPVAIDAASFDAVLRALQPRLALHVENRLQDDDSELPVELVFRSLDDFGPAAVVQQVPALAALLGRRTDFGAPVAPAAAAAPVDLLDEMLAGAAVGPAEGAAADVDLVLARQLDAILQHAEFQRLEASWRGLHRLVGAVVAGSCVQVRLLVVSRAELQAEAAAARAVDESLLWQALRRGGAGPEGLFVADFGFCRNPADVAVLGWLAQVAARCHAPCLTAPSPDLFGLDGWARWAELPRLAKVFDKTDPANTKWLAFRDRPESRFVTLVLPRYLARAPYAGAELGAVGHAYNEAAFTGADLLWANAAWLLAANIATEVETRGWCAHLVGGDAPPGAGWAMVVPGGGGGAGGFGPLEGAVGDGLELELHAAGIVVARQVAGGAPECAAVAFRAAPTTHRPRQFTDATATASASLSAQLPNLLVLSQFVHHLQRHLENGVRRSPAQLAADGTAWLQRCVQDDADAVPEAGRPLLDGYLEVEADPRAPGSCRAVLGLCWEGLSTFVQTEFRL